MGIFTLMMGISKVGKDGVMQSFENNPEVVLGIVKVLSGLIIFQIVFCLLSIRLSILLKGDQIFVKKWFRTVTYPVATIKHVADVVSIATIGHTLHMRFEGKVLGKNIDMRLYREKDVKQVLAFIQSIKG
ncbi:hypothetical protein [Isobaculum melis]|nr:hypothetical protein [Isobaculum melis]